MFVEMRPVLLFGSYIDICSSIFFSVSFGILSSHYSSNLSKQQKRLCCNALLTGQHIPLETRRDIEWEM